MRFKFGVPAGAACLLALFACAASAQLRLTEAGQINHLPETVIAEQGGEAITLAEFDAKLREVPEADRSGFSNDPERLEVMIRNLLLAKQLSAEARKLELDKDPVFQAEVANATAKHLAVRRMEHFQRNLKDPNFDELARERYLAQKEKFILPDTVEIEYLTLTLFGREKKPAQDLAQDIRNRVLAGEAFRPLIEANSDEKPVQDRPIGYFKEFTKGSAVGGFEELVFGLKPGEMSEVVEINRNLYLVKVLSRTPGKTLSYDEVKKSIVETLRTEFRQRSESDYVDNIRSNELKWNESILPDLRSRHEVVNQASAGSTATTD